MECAATPISCWRDRQRAPARRALTLGLAAALLSSGCLTRSGEQRLGAEAAEQVEQTMGLLPDSDLTRYVSSVCERLAAVSDLPEGPWTFQVADTPEPNAFAIPGGHVYVTRGLLALLNSEEELAGVMGHELGHVTDRHTSKRFSAAVVTSPITIATGIVGFAAGIVSPTIGDAVAGGGRALTRGLVLAPYSRSQENAADRIGQELAADAGYDPAGLTGFLSTLDREAQRLSGAAPERSFFADHPLTRDRIEETAERAKELPRRPGEPIASPAELLALLDGLIVGDDPAEGVFRAELFLHPIFDLTVRFPAGWKTRNTKAAAGAFSEDERAVVFLTIAAKETTLDEALTQLRREVPGIAIEELEIAGLPAARARSQQRSTAGVVTWIEYRDDLYAVVGRTEKDLAARYDAAFRTTAASFRQITKPQRESIRIVRLRVRQALSGETPKAIAERLGSTWDAEEIAIANGVANDAAFPAGAAVKVALPEPWRGPARSDR